MAKYIITADQTKYYTSEVFVNADSEEQALQLVQNNINNGEHDNSWDYDGCNNIELDAELIEVK